jgi:hypothetical protein
MSIVSEITQYNCDQAKCCTATYICALMRERVIPFGRAYMTISMNELVGRVANIDEIKYKECESRYCSDWQLSGMNFKVELQRKMQEYITRPWGLCLNCYKNEGIYKFDGECPVCH